MAKIHSYLTFGGNCREAMNFYKDCFGGELMFQTVGDSPLSGKLPKKMKDCILHSTLTNKNLVLMGSDMTPVSGLKNGNAIALVLNCKSVDEITDLYFKLSRGGKADQIIEETFWGALFGNLTDRYGHHWILNYNRKF
jgi:PhnB protein